MKKLIFISVFYFVASVNLYSQTKQESIKELFHLMHQDSMIDKMFSTMIPSMLNQMQGQTKDSSSIARSKRMMDSTMQEVKEFSKKLIDEDMVVIYDKYFSQEEINDFISFYKSPSGQKYLKMSPEITKELMMIMMQKYMPEMQKMMNIKFEELKNNNQK